MKKMSIKLKIALLITVFMIGLSAALFLFILLLSGANTSRNRSETLTSAVEENVGEVEYDDGELDIDDDFATYRNGVTCLLYASDGTLLYGAAPDAKLGSATLTGGSVRTIVAGGTSYLLYDRLLTFSEGADLWIRGFVPADASTLSSSAVIGAALIALPLLVLLAAAGGYLIARRLLRPIRHISETARSIGTGTDLTRRIPIEENGDELHELAGTFNRMFDRLEANFAAERRFTSDASHELRTPVTIIQAQCEYAFENATGEDELYEAIGAIQKQSYRMSRLIESLLRFTRLDQHTEDIRLADTDISALVTDVCAEQQQMAVKGITLTCAVESGIVLPADPDLFARMLSNLIGNAYRYGKENGHTRVTLKREERVVLRVQDDGIGIDAEDLPHITERFYRASKSRGGSGFGLGLSMVSQIAKLFGATLHITSEPGVGSVFSVVF